MTTSSTNPLPADPALLAGATMSDRLWPLVQATLFRGSFHNWYRFRNGLLRAFGAKIDPTVRIRPSCTIHRPRHLSMGRKSALGDDVTIFAHAPVAIGARVVVSQYCQVNAYTQDVAKLDAPVAPAPVTIGDDAWVAADSVVQGPIDVPAGVLVGARSVIRGPLEPWSIASGDPAQSRRPRPYNGARPEGVASAASSGAGSSGAGGSGGSAA